MIHVENLTKRYGKFTAVDNITFTANPGHVTGFLGPNGAGKSTAMRMMTGLTPPTSGTSTIFDLPYRKIPNPSRFVGTMLDASAQHNGRTGREVLTLASMAVDAPATRVSQVLDAVGLTEKEANRRIGNYSLGMRQRLGLGAALIGDPFVLILDEPANGLDPAGIRWMRELLREYAGGGTTVLLSSHLLTEVEQIADYFVLIGQGKIVAEGSKKELLNTGGAIVDALDLAALRAALIGAGFSADPSDKGGLRTDADPEQVGHIAAQGAIVLTSLVEVSDGLEQTFLSITADDAREEAVA